MRSLCSARCSGWLRRGLRQNPDGAPDLFKSVLCRETICKLELRWHEDRLGAYVAAITHPVYNNFDPAIAVTPIGPKDADQIELIEVYLKRKPPQAQPETL